MSSYLTFTPSGVSVPEIWVGAMGDSTLDGLGPSAPYGREVGDTNWTGVYQVRVDGTIDADTTPLETIAFTNGGADRFSWLEYFGKRRQELTGQNIYLVQCGVGGAHLSGSDSWGVGNPLHETAISRINTAIASALAAEPTAQFMGFVDELGSNDGGYEPFHTDYIAAIEDMRSRVFMNGVSGTTAANVDYLFVAQSPDGHLQLSSSYLDIDWARRDAMLATTGGRYYFPGAGLGDLHWFAAGIRAVGTGAAELLEDTTPPSFSVITDYSIPTNGPYKQDLVGADDVNWFLSGPDEAAFEIVRSPYAASGSGYDGGRTRHAAQWAGGATHASGTFQYTVNAMGGNGVVASVDVVVSVGVAPYTGADVILGSSLIGWGEAADLADGAVSTWANKAGTAHMSDLVQATAGSRPVRAATSYNSAKPGVTFDGSDDVLEATLTSLPADTPLQVIAAWQPASGGDTNGRLISVNGASGNDYDNYIPLLFDTSGVKFTGYMAIFLGEATASNGSPHVIASVFDKDPDSAVTVHHMVVDGVAGTGSSPFSFPSFTQTRLTIGGSTAGDNLPGVMAAYAVATELLSDAQMTMLTSYFGTLA